MWRKKGDERVRLTGGGCVATLRITHTERGRLIGEILAEFYRFLIGSFGVSLGGRAEGKPEGKVAIKHLAASNYSQTAETRNCATLFNHPSVSSILIDIFELVLNISFLSCSISPSSWTTSPRMPCWVSCSATPSCPECEVAGKPWRARTEATSPRRRLSRRTSRPSTATRSAGTVGRSRPCRT